MKKHDFSRKTRALALLVTMAMVFSLIPGLSFAAGDPEIIDGPPGISITKTELGADGKALSNIRTTKSVSAGSSTTMGNKLKDNNEATGTDGDKYYISTGHFTYVKQNYAELLAAPYGIDYDIVQGSNFDIVGTANVKIENGKIVVTVGSSTANIKGNWGVVALNAPYGGGKHPHQGGGPLKHDQNGKSTAIDIPSGIGEYIYLYFHNQNTMSITEIYEEAFDFIFQIKDAQGYPVPITRYNIIFRKLSGNPAIEDEIVVNGGALLNDGIDGQFTLKNGITATIVGLPPGNYTITELNNDEYITTIQPTDDVSNSFDFTITEEGLVLIEFENKMKSHTLTVSKEVTDGTTAIADDNEFEVMITLSGTGTDGKNLVFSAVRINDEENYESTFNSNKTVWTVKLKGGEDVTFLNLPKGTHYEITEVNLRPSYTIHSTSEYLVGTIGDDEDYEAKLVNMYSPVAELTLKAKKTVTSNREPASWSFDFELYETDDDGEPSASDLLETKTATKSNPSVTFSTIGKQLSGDYFFLIKEKSAVTDGWTYDTIEYFIKATVALVGSELKTTDVLYQSRTDSSEDWDTGNWQTFDEAVAFDFTNDYLYQAAPAELRLPIRKTVNSGAPPKEFKFTVQDADGVYSGTEGTPVAWATKPASSSSSTTWNSYFSVIEFTRPYDYRFVISEDEVTDAAWTSNTPPITVYVRVTDDGSGTLKATAYKNANFSGAISASSDLEFKNTWTPAPLTPVSTQLQATKTVSGSNLPDDWSFDIELFASTSGGSQGASLKTKTALSASAVGNAAAVLFDDSDVANLNFRSAGEYYFLIRETSLSGNGWTASGVSYHIWVTVKAGTGTQSGALVVSQIQYRTRTGSASWGRWSNYSGSAVTFNNTYTFTPGQTSLTLSGVKTINTGAPDDTFSFSVKSSVTDELYSKATYKWPGAFEFEPITFSTNQTSSGPIPGGYSIGLSGDGPWDFEFVVSEDEPSNDWVCNTEPITIYVTVRDTSAAQDGSRLNAVAYSISPLTPLTATDLTFDNYYPVISPQEEPYYELELIKYVKAVNGRETGQNGREDPKPVPAVRRGATITYVIAVYNIGTLPVNIEEIADQIPEGLEYDSNNDAMGWTYDETTREARISLYDQDIMLEPDEYTSVEILLTVDRSIAIGSTLENVAEINWYSDKDRDNFTDGRRYHDHARVRVVGNDPEDLGGNDGGTPIPEGDDDDDDDDDDIVVTETDSDRDTDSDNDSDTDSDSDGDTDDDDDLPEIEPGHTLVRQGDRYIEFDADGVPLGEWYWDDDLEEWVFDEYPPPLGNLPPTSDNSIPVLLFILAGFCLLSAGCGFTWLKLRWVIEGFSRKN